MEIFVCAKNTQTEMFSIICEHLSVCPIKRCRLLVGPKIHIAHGSWKKSKMLYNWQEEKENKKQLVNTDDLSV